MNSAMYRCRRPGAAVRGVLRPARLDRCPRRRAAAIYSVLTRVADHPSRRIAEILPWNWQPTNPQRPAA
jgi:hypothetical protein